MVSYVLYKDKLKDEYLKAFDFVETYAVTLEVPEQEMEEMLNSLLDSLYEAQEDQKPVEKIVGNDLKKFCENYFENYTYLGNFFKSLVPMFYRFAIVVFLFTLLDMSQLEEGVSLFSATTDIGGFLCGAVAGILAGVIGSAMAKAFLFHLKKFTQKKFTWMTIVIFIIAIAVAVMICEDVNIVVPLFPVLLVSVGYIVLYKLAEWTIRYRKYGTIRRSAEERYTFKDTMKEIWDYENRDIQFELLEKLVKLYEKKNARLLKRGKAVITPREHTEKVRKDIGLMKYDLPYFIILFAICVGGPAFFMEYESVMDLVIYLVIMVCVEGAVLSFLYKAAKAGSKEKAALLALCDAEEITLFELWKREKEKRNSLDKS